MSDDLKHLDFAPTCALRHTETEEDCDQPAKWIASVHVHKTDMARLIICDKHLFIHQWLEKQIDTRYGVPRCSTCQQSIKPGDFISDVEEM